MPGKNVIKHYLEGGYYHIYNRGVEKRKIFQDGQDYDFFLYCLKTILLPESEKGKIVHPDQIKLGENLKLIAFCLRPNHFHLLVWQKEKNSIETLMRRLATKYVIYFNKKNKRVGALFQNTYKAILIETDNSLLHLSRYIHLNPIGANKDTPLQRSILENLEKLEQAHSSYKAYLGKQKIEWLHPEEILVFFGQARRMHLGDCTSYQSFVENYKTDPRELLENLTLD